MCDASGWLGAVPTLSVCEAGLRGRWTGMNWTGLIRAEPRNGSARCDLDLTGDHCPRWHWDLVDINSGQSRKSTPE